MVDPTRTTTETRWTQVIGQCIAQWWREKETIIRVVFLTYRQQCLRGHRNENFWKKFPEHIILYREEQLDDQQDQHSHAAGLSNHRLEKGHKFHWQLQPLMSASAAAKHLSTPLHHQPQSVRAPQAGLAQHIPRWRVAAMRHAGVWHSGAGDRGTVTMSYRHHPEWQACVSSGGRQPWARGLVYSLDSLILFLNSTHFRL